MTALEKRNLALFHEMIREQSLKPTLTTSKVLAVGLAMLIHASTVGVTILGINFVVNAFRSRDIAVVIFYIILGLTCFAIVWRIAPRFLFKQPDHVLPRLHFPVIYGRADSIAKVLNVPPVDGIIFTHEYNAAISRIGLKRKIYLTIGVPIWFVLDDQERIALLAHELAHAANNDFSRGLIVGTACQSLERWYVNFRASMIIPAFQMIFLQLFAGIIWMILSALRRLMFEESQRAEYLADAASAQIAGTDATVRALTKLGFSIEYASFLKRNFDTHRTDRLLERFRNYITDLPDEKQASINRTREEKEALYSLTHPPLAYRLGYLKAHVVPEPKIQLTTGQASVMKQEFALIAKEIEKYYVNAERDKFMYR